MEEKSMIYYNQKTRIISSTIGCLLSMGGFINHGLFEILQGNTPTNGLFIEAISKSHRFWIYGTEGAFTLIPNFLLTGICVMLVSLAIIVWSIKFINIKHGANVFLSLLILLTLVGGGIGHIVLFLPTWAYATRIHKPLSWWGNILSMRVRKILAKLWMPMLIMTSLSWLIVMELGIFGFIPGQTNPDTILNTCLGFLLLTVFLANLTYICGFAQDIEERNMFEDVKKGIENVT
jgi:hypothetical protein